MNRFHAVVAVGRGKGRKHESLYFGEDATQAQAINEKAILDPKFEEVGLALNIPYIRTCCPKAQAVNAATKAQKTAPTPEVIQPKPETTLQGKKS